MRNALYKKNGQGIYQSTKKKAANPPESLARSSIYRSNDGDREYNSPDTLK